MRKQFNEDAYRDRQLNKYLEEDEGVLSNCCGALILEGTDICSECLEHCVTKTEEAEMARDDAGDAKLEEAREARYEND